MRINQYKTILDKGTLLSLLVKEHGFNYGFEIKLNEPSSVYKFMEDNYRLSYEAVEHVYMLAFNCKFQLIGVFKISDGAVNCSLVPSREIYIKALLCNATSIILVHNHPTQDTSPSGEDIISTKKLKEAGDMIGVTLQDHIIIGNNYCSLKEHGIL